MIMRRVKKNDDRGIALVSVMICVMLCFLLSATILRISLLSYLQKGIGKQAASTFYENETFMDDIKMGVQQKVAAAFSDCFTNKSERDVFLTTFVSKLCLDGGVTVTTSTSEADKREAIAKAFRSYIVTGAANTIKVVSVTVDGATDGSAFVQEGDGEIVIKNVRIEYEDKSKGGYVSSIKTDIRVRTPFYTVTTTESNGGYSMLAGGGTQATSGDAQDSLFKQMGNFYSGYQAGTYSTTSGRAVATALTISGEAIVWFDGDDVTINGDVVMSDNTKLVLVGKSVTVRGTIYVGKHAKLIIGKNTELVCRDIVMDVKNSDGDEVSVHVATDDYTGTAEYPHVPYPKKGNYAGKLQSDYEDLDYNGNEADSTFDYGGPKTDKADAWQCVFICSKDNVGADLQGTTTEISCSGGSITPSNKITLTDKSGTAAADIAKTTPNKNTPIGSRDYDQEFLKVVDIYWFLNGCTSSVAGNYVSRPEKKIKSGMYDEGNSSSESGTLKTNQPKFYLKSDYTDRNTSMDSGPNQNNWGAMDATVTVGNPPDVYNVGSHFILANNTVTFNDQNTSQDCYVVCISPEVVIMKPKDGGIMSIKPLREKPGKTFDQYKEFIDAVGLTVVQKDANYTSYCITNNFFKGGIKSLYADNSESTGTQTVTVTSLDQSKNQSADVVSFENWEKDPEPTPAPTGT